VANLEMKLEEQLIDIRSDQIAYKLTITNLDSEPIYLQSVEPRVPIGASLLEVIDSSLAQANTLKAELVSELTRLLRQYLWVTSAAFRQQWVDKQKEALTQVFSIFGFLRFYFEIFFKPASFQARMKREFAVVSFKISSSVDARSAFEKWMVPSTEHEAIKTLFEEKTKQLERIEARMDESDRPGLTSIPPTSFFTATYVLKFSRRAFEPRKFQVGFDAIYSQVNSPPQSNSVSTTLQISPYPFSLSLIACFSAILGIILRLSISGTINPLSVIFDMAISGQLLVGPIVAFIFFNVYEHTSVGRDIGISVSWRSALLIGALAGLAQDRLLRSLQALIGA
jgi:hypothetical protein